MSQVAGRPRWIGMLDRISVLATLIVWGVVIARVAPVYIADASSGWTLLLGGVIGYLVADFVSGVVHWLADQFFDPDVPILGPALIAPFRDHHEDPLAITRHDLFERSGNNGLTTIPLGLCLLIFPTAQSFVAQTITASVIFAGFAIIATNQFHCWAHVERPPALARRLQDWGLILSPERHALHHCGEHDRAYCVTSGWLNGILDRFRIFPRLERSIRRHDRRTARG